MRMWTSAYVTQQLLLPFLIVLIFTEEQGPYVY